MSVATIRVVHHDGSAREVIDLTGVSLPRLVQAAYNLSKPQGYGWLHAEPGDLPLEEAEAVVLAQRGCPTPSCTSIT